MRREEREGRSVRKGEGEKGRWIRTVRERKEKASMIMKKMTYSG